MASCLWLGSRVALQFCLVQLASWLSMALAKGVTLSSTVTSGKCQGLLLSVEHVDVVRSLQIRQQQIVHPHLPPYPPNSAKESTLNTPQGQG